MGESPSWPLTLCMLSLTLPNGSRIIKTSGAQLSDVAIGSSGALDDSFSVPCIMNAGCDSKARLCLCVELWGTTRSS